MAYLIVNISNASIDLKIDEGERFILDDLPDGFYKLYANNRISLESIDLYEQTLHPEDISAKHTNKFADMINKMKGVVKCIRSLITRIK